MGELKQVGSLWVPAADKKIRPDHPFYGDMPDLDVSKAAKALEFCSSFDMALDVGAYVGAVTLLLAQRFDKVVAFEAIPETFEALKANAGRLPNVTLQPLAVSDRPMELYFEHLPRFGQLSHGLRQEDAHSATTIGPIQAVSLDSFGFDKVSFIKIDVEGLEPEVIEGAKDMILRCRPTILIEQGNPGESHPRDRASEQLEEMGMTRVEEFDFRRDRVYRFV